MVTRPGFPYLFAVLFACEVAGRCSSSFLQGHPPSLRFGHPDVTFGRYRLSLLGVAGYRAGAAAFSGCALRVSNGRSPQRSKERAERPGDGCPCVGAEETCGAHHQKQSRTPIPQAMKTAFQGERKNPADSEESAGFSFKCAPWDSNPEPID